MKLPLFTLAPLALAALCSMPVRAADAGITAKAAKPAAAEAAKQKPAASAELARKDTKAEAPGKPRQQEVPVAVVLAAD